MKSLVLTLLLTTLSYCQTVSVSGVILSYDGTKHTTTLTIPQLVVTTKDIQHQVEIIISRSYSISINQRNVSYYFKFTGYKYDNISGFEYETAIKTQYIFENKNYIFEFMNLPSDEYIIEVNNIHNKIVVNKQSSSIIIE